MFGNDQDKDRAPQDILLSSLSSTSHVRLLRRASKGSFRRDHYRPGGCHSRPAPLQPDEHKRIVEKLHSHVCLLKRPSARCINARNSSHHVHGSLRAFDRDVAHGADTRLLVHTAAAYRCDRSMITRNERGGWMGACNFQALCLLFSFFVRTQARDAVTASWKLQTMAMGMHVQAVWQW